MNSPPPPATWAPGAIIPGTVYRVIRPLGVGGMGEVYEAEHELLGVRRALKVLSRKLASREDLAERLRVEARALAKLKHPNLVEVNDLGMASDGRVFFAMELLSGATLRDLMHRTGPLRPDQAAAIATQLLDALDAAHQQGMVHRDVKPENVFVLRTGTVKLLDFGIAKALQGNQHGPALTAAGVAIGTPRYMSPEQAEGQPVDARSDVYSVGVVLWEMLSGQPPYAHLDALAAAVAAATRGLPPLHEVGVTSLPDDLRAALERATARLASQRHPSAAAFAADLRLARGRIDGSSSSADKVTARYETSMTALMPVLAEITDPGTAPTELADTNPITRHATTTGFSPVHTSELITTAPTEALLLRDSLPFDPRDQPTPTSLPPAAPRVSLPSVAPATAAAPAAPAAPAPRAFWAALPVAVLLTAGATWWISRPSPVAPQATATLTSVAPAVVVASAAPVEPAATAPAASQATAEPAASQASADPPAASATPRLKAAGKTPGKAAPPTKTKYGSTLPQSGL